MTTRGGQNCELTSLSRSLKVRKPLNASEMSNNFVFFFSTMKSATFCIYFIVAYFLTKLA